jgi:hypothetical protein
VLSIEHQIFTAKPASPDQILQGVEMMTIVLAQPHDFVGQPARELFGWVDMEEGQPAVFLHEPVRF